MTEPQNASPSHEAEGTINKFFQFFADYFRTLFTLATPYRGARRLVPEEEADGLMPPLAFLAVSSFPLVLFIGYVFSLTRYTSDPAGLFRYLSQRVSSGLTILGVFFSALPVVLVTVALGLAFAYLLGRSETPARRERLRAFFLYAFGLHAAAFFLVILSLGAFRLLQQVFSWAWPDAKAVTWALGVFALVWFAYILLQPLALLCQALWRFDRGRTLRCKLLRQLAPVILFPAALLAGWTMASLPSQFDLAMNPERPPVLVVLPERVMGKSLYLHTRSKGGTHELIVDLGVRNPTASPVFFIRQSCKVTFLKGSEETETLYPPVTAWADGAAPLLTVRPGELKWLRCAGPIPDAALEKLYEPHPPDFHVKLYWTPDPAELPKGEFMELTTERFAGHASPAEPTY